MKTISWKKITLFFIGFIALCWFLIRVIPKPSRATYPCQQAAFPLASAFVIWISSLFTSALLFVKFKKSLTENKLVYAAIFFILSGMSFLIYLSFNPSNNLFANSFSNYTKAVWDGAERLAKLKSNTTTYYEEVAIVKSSQPNASDISIDEIEAMVRESVIMAGGLEEIISNGDYVVLKPNLVGLPPAAGYDQVSGIATDWRVTKAVAKIVRELNPDGKIYIIESSAASSTNDIFDYYHYSIENFPEVNHIVALEDSCGAFEDYSDENLDIVFLEDSIRLYPDEQKPNLSPEFYINKIYNSADVVISIPVLKNHKEAIITSGIKNVAIGMAPPNIYGMSETFFGKWTKIDHSLENLNKWIHDFFLCHPVDFVIVDGLQGFDHGPTGALGLSMEEMQHNMRLIISGKNALSVDAVSGCIMSLDPTFANYMVYLDDEDYGVGTIDSKFIRFKGEIISEIRESFLHTSEVTTNALYTDYEPPTVEVVSSSIAENIITLTIDGNEDLNKVEVEVNDVLLDQVWVNDFTTAIFDVSEELIPVESLILFAYDRFFNKSSIPVDIAGINETIPNCAKLDQNFPNPFIQSTTIPFTLQKTSLVKLFVIGQNGKLIDNIANEKLQAGEYQFNWHGNISSGVYFYTLEVDGNSITKQMIKK